ncbi:DNA polymerase III subunit delta [Sediminitomix flava]|uniref:DNA polymerase III subunit delta n=1 Tax=Sediminitomix flava TaxID=379075 RepID=A0A315ZZM6_SEDFL|nr:DNA polymerase III subunit delta [Sediminitomix flava]PWJ42827.1 DNA polymerase III delta subunit [Sediminitomix flava]
MAKTPDAVIKELKAKTFAPVYFLQGDEPFYIDEISRLIEENALTPSEKSFNQTILYGKDISMNQLLESARRFPMMAQRQVIILKEAQEMPDFGRKTAQEQLVNYIKQPVPTTILVFVYKHKKINKNTSLWKTMDKKVVLVDSKKIYDNKLPTWVKSYVKNLGHSIKDKPATLIAEHIGNDLTRISNEINKMMINYPDDAVEITESMISKHIGISREYNVFELQAALGKRDVLKANQIINFFASDPKSNPVIPIISMLFSYFSKVLLVHHNAGQTKEEAAKLLGVSPYFVADYFTAARNYPLPKTVQIIDVLHQADLQSKGVDSSIAENQILKELIYKIMH